MPEDIHYSIIQGLAEAEGTDPEDLEVCLHNHTDIDALAKLYRQGHTNPTVTFEIGNHEIRVTPEGEVHVNGNPQPLSAGR